MTNNVIGTVLASHQQPKKGSEFPKGTKTIFGQTVCDECILYKIFVQEYRGSKLELTQQFVSEKELDITNDQYIIIQCANGIPRLVPKKLIFDTIEPGVENDYLLSPMKQVAIN